MIQRMLTFVYRYSKKGAFLTRTRKIGPGSLFSGTVKQSQPARVNNYVMSASITHPFPNLNGALVEVRKWISNFTRHFTRLEVTYQCWASRCNKNTQHIESSYILQPPKYLLLFVNRFRYINNNITKDRCPIPMDTTVRLGPLKFSLQATIGHHGPSIDSGHYIASINCCKKTFYCNDHTITKFGITDKNSSTAYIVLYKWIDTWFLDSNRRMGVWSLPWRWHILSIPLTTGRGTSAETCGLDDVFPPDDLGSRPEPLC